MKMETVGLSGLTVSTPFAHTDMFSFLRQKVVYEAHAEVRLRKGLHFAKSNTSNVYVIL